MFTQSQRPVVKNTQMRPLCHRNQIVTRPGFPSLTAMVCEMIPSATFRHLDRACALWEAAGAAIRVRSGPGSDRSAEVIRSCWPVMKQKTGEPLALQIARILADRIVSGALPPEAPLRQDHIAAEFGTSHVPVREAFLQLEAQGLVESRPRRGTRVTALEVEDVQEVATMRATLEVLALRHAAPRLNRGILDAAEAANRACEAAIDVREWEAANRRFHRLLLAPCAMPRLLSTIDGLHLASARFLFSAWRTAWEAQTDLDHRAILAALRRGQPDIACSVLARHLGRVGGGGARKNRDSSMAYTIVG